jgi:ABC-type polysaccharide/polyol phosphate transport system ATPase subunit
MDKLVELCGRDCTVMIISHGLALIKVLADRCLWLEGGLVRDEGPGDEVVDAYLNSEDMNDDSEEAMEDF